MIDFASAAMIRVLAQGMRECGLDPGPQARPGAEARVDLRLKQQLVRSALHQGGIGCLTLLGRGLHRLTHEPTHQALASARDALDLMQRWQRLERYIHSRHRCEVHAAGDHHVRVRHVTRTPGGAPSAAEDLVVLGVLAALLEAIGLQRVRASVAGAAAYPEPDVDGIGRAAARAATATWDFRWDGSAPPTPARGLVSAAAELGADGAWPALARAAYLRLVTDLTRTAPLRDLAAELAVPVRTLQRGLSQAGLTYTHLLAEARCRAGAWRLLHTGEPIAEVGFLSGFADQPHFTRELRRRVGMPPAAYREAFGLVRTDRSRMVRQP